MLRLYRSLLLRYGCILAIPLGAACSDATSPNGLTATIEAVQLHSEEEYEAWPFTPEISGGGSIEIRGMAMPGCGAFEIDARRFGKRVIVDVRGKSDVVCVAIISGWQAFTAVVDVPAGSYLVNVNTIGHQRGTSAVVKVR